LPKETPSLDGWYLTEYYQPAREVGGDFYDFLSLPDGRLGVVIGDVTGKGIPAALLMTASRTMLRTVAQQLASPGEVLAQVNQLLRDDMPVGMFVTCFYAILDPESGRLRYANAGQDLPAIRRGGSEVGELRATGMPLGLLPDTRYEEAEAALAPGDLLLFYSDGLIEAHNPEREMFGLARLRSVLAETIPPVGPALLEGLRQALATFTGASWEQEDDVTLVALQRLESQARP
jgi:serine phosphatase RsbU (regulator of sigma subunit)